MAKHKQKKEDEKMAETATPNRTGVPLHIYIPQELRDALDGAARANRRKVTQEVILALEAHLQAQGCWPPQQDE